MQITSFQVGRVALPLRKPFKTALRTVEHAEDVIVRLTTDTGLVGFGEAPPTERITGDSAASIRAALVDHVGPALLGADPRDLATMVSAIERAISGNSSARAAADIAAHDLWGKALEQPVVRLFGGSPGIVTTDLTISVDTPEVMARDAAEALTRGFSTLKIKVGQDGNLDVERLRAVRAVTGPAVAIRIDANQGWTPAEAVEALQRMTNEGLDIEFCEQPTPAKDIDGMGYVRQRVSIPIMADESVHSPRDAQAVLAAGAADLVNIKLMKTGGLRGARDICALARACGAQCMIGCMLEGRASVMAAIHLARAEDVITKIDLDGPLLMASDPAIGGVTLDGPALPTGDGPGFGITDIEGLVITDSGTIS